MLSMKNNKSILIIITLILVGFVLWKEGIYPFDFTKKIEDFELEGVQKQVNTPPPLRGPSEARGTFLSSSEVIKWTNIHREQNGLGSLGINTKLHKSALNKAKDMFNRQYFAHNSPSGEGVAGLVEDAGYEFILIGENLALGNFENEEELVKAWMDSPGHRANILNASYLEIGVGVIQGTFEDKSTWIAVQHFGKPKSACTSPSETLAVQIETNKQNLLDIELELDAKERELKALDRKSSQYNEKASEYNALVEKYNALTNETKNLVNMYNSQVKLFNKCATS